MSILALQLAFGLRSRFRVSSLEFSQICAISRYHFPDGWGQWKRTHRNCVSLFTPKYLNLAQQVETEQVDERRQHKAIAYLLEESALIACVIKQEWLVFVYPGSIKTFEDISEGLQPEVPLPLKQMLWVSLRLKKWTTRSGHELQE